jgi:hypothetical protein
MNIEFTKDEYRVLIKMLYISDWLITAHDTEPDASKAKYAAIEQKIFAYAQQMGCQDLVTRDGQEYFPTAKFDEEDDVRGLIDDYNENCFWDELISRMTDRDAAKLAPVKNRTVEEAFALTSTIEEQYADEFAEYGLSRLKIDKQ